MMSELERTATPMSMHVFDISPTVIAVGPSGPIDINDTVVRLLHDMNQLQRQQLDMSREMFQFQREYRQRQQAELEAWQRDNKEVVENCRSVLGILSRVHSGMLKEMAEYIRENEEMLLESEFSISEFVDRFGPRLHHLSAMLGVLKQASTPSTNEAGQGSQGA